MAIPSTQFSGVKIHDVRVSNFRSLSRVDVELDELTVLVGANNVGKTSFLDAMHAAIGASRKILGPDDIHIANREAFAPIDRFVTIDIRVIPVDRENQRVENFEAGSFWTNLWGLGISQDEEFRDFMAFRTTLGWSHVKGDYAIEKKFIKEWKPFAEWLPAPITEDRTISSYQIEPIAMHYIDAKRDLDDDLRRQGSFWRRLTDNLGLSNDDVAELEQGLTALNEGIVSKSEVLKHLKENLVDIGSVVSTDAAEIDIAPIARRLRDLSKGIDVTLATRGAQSFPLIRHGMGTRSLASLLVFRAYASWRYKLATQEGDTIHSLLALEEPESHLHPQAQRALFSQIKSIPGQRIVSTHSPYFAGQAKLTELRLFIKDNGITTASKLDISDLSADDVRKLERTVVATRGDLLFATAIILFEGDTEEQAFPLWAQEYWGASVHELGFNFIGVGGQDYFPFVWLARSLGLPWYLFSDGEDITITRLNRNLLKAGIQNVPDHNNIVVLPNKDDLEAYLMREGYSDAFEEAIKNAESETALDEYIDELDGEAGKKVDGVTPIRDYRTEGGRLRAMLDKISGHKTRYATPLATAILGLSPDRNIPPAVASFFDVIAADFNLPRKVYPEEPSP